MLEIADNPGIYYTKLNKWDISYLSLSRGFSYETHSIIFLEQLNE
jgi:hypothetical protein